MELFKSPVAPIPATGGEAATFTLTQARVPSLGEGAWDIFIAEGTIAALRPADASKRMEEAPADAPAFDAANALLFPSFIDAHAHFRDPGQEYKEDIESGLAAAAHGGFGQVMVMANTVPVNDSAAITRYMLEKSAACAPHGPKLLPIGALTMGLEGKALAPMGELTDAGCAAFSNDGKPVTNTEIFRRGMEYAAQFGRAVIDHCEDEFLAKGSHMNEGELSSRMGVKGQPGVAEALHVARDILLSEYLDLPVHLAHISAKASLDLIRSAKERGVKVTAEACPHHLFLDESALAGYDTAAKVNPPLRSAEDIAALKKAVQEGIIDIFATDHAPHAQHEKEHPLDEAPNGMIGLETAVSLTYSLVREASITHEDFIRLWAYAPARIFSLGCTTFTVGDRADFFLFNPDAVWVPSRETLHSKSLNTPFLGSELTGKVTAHWLGGKKIL